MWMVGWVASLFVACEPTPPSPPPVPGELERSGATLVEVNGAAVTQGMLDAYIARLPDEVRERMLADASQIARLQDQLVVTELLVQEAIGRKLYEKPEVKRLLAFAEREALANALLQQVVQQRTTDEAIKGWYADHAEQYRRAQVKVLQVMVQSEAEANALIKELEGGADFAAKARDNGRDPEWMDAKSLLPQIADPVFAAEKGAIVGPLNLRGQYLILKVVDKRDAIPFEEVTDQVKSMMSSEITNSYVEELKKSAHLGYPAQAVKAE